MSEQITDRSTAEYLQELILGTGDVQEFLNEFSRFSAQRLSDERGQVLCGVTLLRNKRAGTVASSSEHARQLDEIQYTFAAGPCLTASSEQITVQVPDVEADDRWPEYLHAVAEQGINSILAVPFHLESDTRAALNLYSYNRGRFDGSAVETAEGFVQQTSNALALAVRLAQHNDSVVNLKAAMESRTAIDISIGIIMAQNRCSQERAFEILKSASNSRNLKVRDIAAGVVASISQQGPRTHFEP